MIFNTIEKFNEFSDSSSGIRFNAIKPSIEHAVSKYLYPVFGEGYIQNLDAMFNGTGAISATNKKLLDSLCYALASFTLYEYAPIADVQITDKGVRRGESTELPGAFKYQTEKYQKTVLDRGFLHLENAIKVAETIVTNTNNNDANAWMNSLEFTQYRELIVATGSEFQQQISSIKYPRRLFMLLRTSFINVQELTIRESISPAIYDEILNVLKTRNPEFTAQQLALLKPLKKAISHLALARGISSLIANMDENGIHVLNNNSDATSATSKQTAASDNVLSFLIREHESAGTAWLQKSIEVINANCSSTVWVDWYNKLNPPTPIPKTEQQYNGIATF